MLCAPGCDFQMLTFTRTRTLLWNGLPAVQPGSYGKWLSWCCKRDRSVQESIKEPGYCSSRKELPCLNLTPTLGMFENRAIGGCLPRLGRQHQSYVFKLGLHDITCNLLLACSPQDVIKLLHHRQYTAGEMLQGPNKRAIASLLSWREPLTEMLIIHTDKTGRGWMKRCIVASVW